MNRFRNMLNSKSAFIPFFMLGDPDLESSTRIIREALDAGADGLELGLPFSDPLADGPTLQRSAQRALSAGASTTRCLEIIAALRACTDKPIGLLVYYNLLYRAGLADMTQRLADVGVDAVLAADVPFEQGAALADALDAHRIGRVQLIAPNTPPLRAKVLLEASTAFTYVIGRYGTTGASGALDAGTAERLRTLRQLSGTPLVVGFGISTPAQLRTLYDHGAHGAIIGSAIADLVEQHHKNPDILQEQVRAFVSACAAQTSKARAHGADSHKETTPC